MKTTWSHKAQVSTKNKIKQSLSFHTLVLPCSEPKIDILCYLLLVIKNLFRCCIHYMSLQVGLMPLASQRTFEELAIAKMLFPPGKENWFLKSATLSSYAQLQKTSDSNFSREVNLFLKQDHEKFSRFLIIRAYVIHYQNFCFKQTLILKESKQHQRVPKYPSQMQSNCYRVQLQ